MLTLLRWPAVRPLPHPPDDLRPPQAHASIAVATPRRGVSFSAAPAARDVARRLPRAGAGSGRATQQDAARQGLTGRNRLGGPGSCGLLRVIAVIAVEVEVAVVEALPRSRRRGAWRRRAVEKQRDLVANKKRFAFWRRGATKERQPLVASRRQGDMLMICWPEKLALPGETRCLAGIFSLIR